MGLNKSKGDMYDWVDYTWNPVKGCKYDCSYCYIKSIKGYSLEPRFHVAEAPSLGVGTDLGTGRVIFVGSTCDMFGPWVWRAWITRVLEYCTRFGNTYLFQTKNPKRFGEFLERFPEKVILGTTLETDRETVHISGAPSTHQRAYDLMEYSRKDKEVTIEPIMDFDLKEFVRMIWEVKPKFVAVGADSKGHNLNEPPRGKVIDLIEELREFTDVKIKKNLDRILKVKDG